MSKLAFIFPGQGAQKAGMGKDFYENSEAARSFFDQAQKILDFDLKEMCFGEHEELNLTEYTQPCMVSVCLAIVQELKKRGINPDITAGLSLGEYAAVAAAVRSRPRRTLPRRRFQSAPASPSDWRRGRKAGRASRRGRGPSRPSCECSSEAGACPPHRCRGRSRPR